MTTKSARLARRSLLARRHAVTPIFGRFGWIRYNRATCERTKQLARAMAMVDNGEHATGIFATTCMNRKQKRDAHFREVYPDYI